MKYEYEIRQVEAWAEGEKEWTYNETWKIDTFKTSAKNHKKAFLNALHKNGIVCNRGKCAVVYDGSIYELLDRKTLEPLFCAIPVNF